MEYNGSAIVAMVGKNCVAIASDKRFGIQALTLSTEYEKVFPINDKIMLGLPGLGSDVETLY
jgi:20S proteasome subunit beta 3